MSEANYQVRNYYHIGAFQQCIKEAEKVNCKTEEIRVERDVYSHRSYIGLGKSKVVLSVISESTQSDALKAVRLLALYESGSNKSGVVDEALALASSTLDSLAQIVLATVLINNKKFEDAIKTLHNNESLDAKSLLVQAYLSIYRFDLAIKTVKTMQELDEDNTLTQLTLAWLYICNGKEKLQEAFYIYQELMDKFGQTASLLISQATVRILKCEYSEAESLIQQADEKDPGSGAVLINQYFVNSVLRKGDESLARTISHLKADHSQLQWVQDFVQHEKMLDEWDE